MNILLTGGAGYIGSHTAVELLEKGHAVIIADNLSNSHPAVIDRIETIAGMRPLFYKADLTDKTETEALFADCVKNGTPIEAVVHFAGYKAVGESVAKPEMYYRNNIDSTLTLLETMEAFGVNKLIFSSSATVYGTEAEAPYTEDSPTGNCSNPYGWTKYMIEKILYGVSLAHPELSVVLLRYFNPVGAHKSGLIGEDPSGIPNNLFPYISQVAVGKREKLSVFGDDYPTPDGTGIRDYIHVTDLAKGHVCALEYAADHKGVEVFNLGSGKGSSVLDIVRTYREASGREIPYVIAPRRAGDLAVSFADPSKAKRLLGWQTELSLFDMCRDSWNWQSQNPNGYRKSEE